MRVGTNCLCVLLIHLNSYGGAVTQVLENALESEIEVDPVMLAAVIPLMDGEVCTASD